MQRSPSQVLFQLLPGAVFSHEDGFIARVEKIIERAANANRDAVLEAVAQAFDMWDPSQRSAPDPRSQPNEYSIVQPEQVRFEVYPLTYACTNPICGRVSRWTQQDQLAAHIDAAGGHLRCAQCSSNMRQLRYLAAHECGQLQPMFVQKCRTCNTSSNMYLDDTGSFDSSMWRCRTCGFSIQTRFTPCDCGRYLSGSGQAFMRGFTERDSHLWQPQMVTLVNIRSSTYDDLQRAGPAAGPVALASWLGDQLDISRSMQEATPTTSVRKTEAEWQALVATLEANGFDEHAIETLRRAQGPITTGASAVETQASPEALELAASRGFVERAGIFDRNILTDLYSLEDLHGRTSGAAQRGAAEGLRSLRSLGVAQAAVSQQFPILMASYGYSRVQKVPGASDLKTYARAGWYDGKNPIFAVPANTEALILTVDAAALLGYLFYRGMVNTAPPPDLRDAKLAMLELFAASHSPGSGSAAGVARRIVHSMSHAMLRALDDGQSGFGESSLGEWINTDALTFAIYVSAYNDFTLGALDTVLRRRVSAWSERAVADVQVCDNDPMCGHISPMRPYASCDRCLHMTFGCTSWNADLDRRLLRDFWNWTGSRV